MKVCFETFGCRLNKAEALQMEAEYLAQGWELTRNHKEANLFIVRGCSVTARAQADCEKLIAHLRHRYPSVPVRVCGCLKQKARTTRTGLAVFSRPTPQKSTVAPLPTRTARAYLKVQDGCAGKCAFCIVPTFRGASKSVDFTETLDKARRFIEAGYHEIVVTGCNLSLYASQGRRLPDLLAALAECDANCRIRIGSVEPGACALETVRAMAEHANVCRFLHLPIQSASARILKAMRRPYAVKDVEDVLTAATELLPGLGLGCDLMTGFPGEDELDFTATKRMLENFPFTNAHVFPYSERTGTVAAGLPSVIPKPLRSSRAHRLSSIAKALRKEYANSFVGKTVEVVIEDEKDNVGWSGEYLRCKVVGTVRRKSLVRVFVTQAKDDLLIGRLD